MISDRDAERVHGTRALQRIARDRAGYEAQPVRPDEFKELIAAQAAAMPEWDLDDEW